MIKIFMLTLLLSLNCYSKDSFFMNTYNNVYLATNIRFDIGDKVNSNKAVDRPKNAWRTIFRADVGKKTFCMAYKIPHKEEGTLELRESTGACDHFKGKLLNKVSGVKNFKVYLVEDDMKVPGFGVVKPFYLTLIYSLDGENKVIEVPLVNFKGRKSFDRYGNGQEKQLMTGISFSRKPRNVKKKSGIYRENKSLACHQVNKLCQDVTENSCNECPNGWYEVVDYNCKQGGSKYCRPSYCGTRGEPACIRGFEFTGTQRSDLCFNGSPAGYCRPGLNTYCDGNKILICL